MTSIIITGLASALLATPSEARFTESAAVGPAGTVRFAAVVDSNGLTNVGMLDSPGVGPTGRILTALRTPAGRLYGPRVLSEEVIGPGCCPPGDAVKMAANRVGDVVIAWASMIERDGPPVLFAAFRSAGKPFSRPVRISAAGEEAQRPDEMVLGDDGVATFMWWGRPSGQDRRTIRMAQRSAVGEVLAPSDFSLGDSTENRPSFGQGFDFELERSIGGHRVVAYNDPDRVLVAVAGPRGPFGAPVIVGRTAFARSGVTDYLFGISDVAISRAGTIAVAWQDGATDIDFGEGTYRGLRAHLAVRSPSSPRFEHRTVRSRGIHGAATNVFAAQLEFDARGFLSIAWALGFGDGRPDAVEVAVRTPRGAFLGRRRLASDAIVSGPDLAVNARGTTSLTFLTGVGSRWSALVAFRGTGRAWTRAARLTADIADAFQIGTGPRVSAAGRVTTFSWLDPRRIPRVRQWIG